MLAVAACGLLFAAGCSTSTGTGGAPTTPAQQGSPNPSTSAVLTIVQPASGSTVNGPTVHVVLTLVGATLVPPGTISGADPTQGHIHLSLDGAVVSMTSGLTQDLSVTVDPAHPSHILQAEFVANNHQSFIPKDLKTVVFNDP